MSQINESDKADVFDLGYGYYLSMISGTVVLIISLQALKVLWKSAERARANDIRMLSDAVALEQVTESNML